MVVRQRGQQSRGWGGAATAPRAATSSGGTARVTCQPSKATSRQGAVQGEQRWGLGGNSHPTEQGRAGGTWEHFPVPVCPSQLMRQHRRSLALD